MRRKTDGTQTRLNDTTSVLLEKALDIRMRAHEMHASNLANSNVPDFKAKKIEFEEALQEALAPYESAGILKAREKTANAQIEKVQAHVFEDPFARVNGDGNSVNPEREQTELAKNTIAYEATLHFLNGKFTLEKFVLSEGSK